MVISVVATRPNFIKMAPVIEQLKLNKIENYFVHTGQHYDDNMSDIFFKDLNMPAPNHFMNIRPGSHAEQTAEVLIKFEKLCMELKPKLVIVAGDVNSTLSCALAAAKLNIPIAHIEAGLRSFDKRMPEEVNRVLTDHVSDILFATERNAIENLKNENILKQKIHFVGNCMIDSLIKNKLEIKKNNAMKKYRLEKDDYCIATIHRPSNVDSGQNLKDLGSFLNKLSNKCKVVFPIHPRTKKMIEKFSISLSKNIILLNPLSYFEFLNLVSNCKFVLTDSGGIQEETTFLGIPCITLRENTERPSTVDVGTNHIVGLNYKRAFELIMDIMANIHKSKNIPEKWDGKSSLRIIKIIKNFLNSYDEEIE